MPDSLKFQLELIDKLTKPGKEMAAQLQKLKLQLNQANTAVKQTEAAMAKLQKAKVVDIATYKKLSVELEHNKAAQLKLRGGVLQQVDAINKAEGSLGGYGGALESLGPIMKGFGAIYAAEVGAILGGGALAIHANEMKNDTIDALEAFVGTADAAKEIYGRIEDMQGQVAISQERGMALARELSAAGVTNKDALVDAIHAIGEVSSVLGEGAGSKIQSIIQRSTATGKFKFNAKQLAGTGVSEGALAAALGITPKQLDAQIKAGKITAEAGIAALSKAIDAKFAGPASKQVLDIGNQFQHLKDNVLKLFEDVDTGGFLTSLNKILKIFDQSTDSGKALKLIVTKVFDALFKIVETVAPYVETFFLGLVVIALKVYIAFKPLLKQLGMIGDQSEGADKLGKAMSILGDVLGWVASKVTELVLDGMAIFDWFMEIETYLVNLPGKFYDAGAAMITGLINGIKNGAGAAVDAVKGIGQSALNEFKGVFGIHSPSKVMAQMGGHLMSGLEQGIDKNGSAPQDAMNAAVAPPTSSGGSSRGGGDVTITLSPGSVVISGVQNAQQVAEMFPEMMADAMELLMIEKGVKAA